MRGPGTAGQAGRKEKLLLNHKSVLARSAASWSCPLGTHSICHRATQRVNAPEAAFRAKIQLHQHKTLAVRSQWATDTPRGLYRAVTASPVLPGPLCSMEGGSAGPAWLQRATKTQESPNEVLLLETQLPKPALPQTGLSSSQAHKFWAGKGTGCHWRTKVKTRNAAAFSWHDAGTSWPSWQVPPRTCLCAAELTWACLKMCMMNMVRPSPKM